MTHGLVTGARLVDYGDRWPMWPGRILHRTQVKSTQRPVAFAETEASQPAFRAVERGPGPAGNQKR